MGDGRYLVQTLGLGFGWTNTWTKWNNCQFANFVSICEFCDESGRVTFLDGDHSGKELEDQFEGLNRKKVK